MDPATLARGLGAGRASLGAVLLVAPTALTRLWVGPDARLPAARLVAMALGAREVAIGLGTIGAVASGADTRPWLQAGVFSDSVDAAMTLALREQLPTSGVVLVMTMASGAAALGTWLSTSAQPPGA